jgi:hypothetical protein
VNIDELIARVEAATGLDARALVGVDCDIHAAFVAKIPKGYVRGSASGSYIIAHHRSGTVWTEKVPPYTSSLDAIVGLIDRDLPGWLGEVDIGVPSHDGHFGGYLCPPNHGGGLAHNRVQFAEGKTRALALCAAFLRAKRALSAPEPRKEERT